MVKWSDRSDRFDQIRSTFRWEIKRRNRHFVPFECASEVLEFHEASHRYCTWGHILESRKARDFGAWLLHSMPVATAFNLFTSIETMTPGFGSIDRERKEEEEALQLSPASSLECSWPSIARWAHGEALQCVKERYGPVTRPLLSLLLMSCLCWAIGRRLAGYWLPDSWLLYLVSYSKHSVWRMHGTNRSRTHLGVFSGLYKD